MPSIDPKTLSDFARRVYVARILTKPPVNAEELATELGVCRERIFQHEYKLRKQMEE